MSYNLAVMSLVYLGISLPNSIRNPLKDKIQFCSAEELTATKISHDEYRSFLEEIKSLDYVNEVTLVSTCNRFEVILDLDRSHKNFNDLEELKSLISKLTNSSVNFNCLFDQDAELQIIRTYCGLNSGLIGEDEICAQMGTSFRQAASLKIAGESCLAVLENAIQLRKFIDKAIYQKEISYCDIAIRKSFEKLNFLEQDLKNLKKVLVLGSGSTAKKTCLSLLKQGVEPSSITVVHRVSQSSVQIEHIKSDKKLQGLNFTRSKDGYHTAKVKELAEDAELIIFGIDTRKTVIKFNKDCRTKIIDFNSNHSCEFEAGFDFRNYVSNLEADSFVRHYANIQTQHEDFGERIEKAEKFIVDFVSGSNKTLSEVESFLVQA